MSKKKFKGKILIVENELDIANGWKNTLLAYNYDVIGIFNTGEAALQYIDEDQPDVVLMDINLDTEMTGIQTAKKIQLKFGKSISIVFLSDVNDQAILSDMNDTFPSNFLPKPVSDAGLLASVDLAMRRKLAATQQVKPLNTQPAPESVFVSAHINEEKRDIRLFFKDIYWIKAEGNICNIVTETQNITYPKQLNELNNRLQHPKLHRVHRSYIVNTDKIDFFEKKKIGLRIPQNNFVVKAKRKTDHFTINVGPNYWDDLMDKIYKI